MYWPGIHRLPEELNQCFAELQKIGFRVTWMNVPYDKGLTPDQPSSQIQYYIMNQKSAVFSWWIGLSLGASVAYIVAATIPVQYQPKRLTLINAFADREKLAQEKGFSLNGQWVIFPSKYTLPSSVEVDFIISKQDDKIPKSQSNSLREVLISNQVRIIELDTDHAINNIEQQQILAKQLVG